MTSTNAPQPTPQPPSRRTFLHTSLSVAGAVGLGGLATGCSTATSSTGGGAKSGTVTVMYKSNEFTKDHIAEFEKLNPGMKIEFIEYDVSRINAMLASGNPPDLVRGGADANIFARGLAAPIDDYLKGSSIKEADLLSINEGWRWDGKKVGAGPRYGLVKDWSQDGAMWMNTALFTEAGVTPLDPVKPGSWDDLLASAKKLTVRKNGKVEQFGLGMEWAWGLSSVLHLMILQQGGSLYNADGSEVNFTGPEATRAMEWFAEFGRSNVGPTSLNPLPDGMDSSTFGAGRMAVSMDGYWFGGNFTKSPAAFQTTLQMAPAPTFGKALNFSFNGGMGAWIPAKSKNKDGAWKVMEYFIAGPPAVERAKSGWGLPALKSLWSNLPQELPYQAAAIKTATAELENNITPPATPYVNGAVLVAAVDDALTSILKGTAVASACGSLQDTVNKALKQGKSQIG